MRGCHCTPSRHPTHLQRQAVSDLGLHHGTLLPQQAGAPGRPASGPPLLRIRLVHGRVLLQQLQQPPQPLLCLLQPLAAAAAAHVCGHAAGGVENLCCAWGQLALERLQRLVLPGDGVLVPAGWHVWLFCVS
jgi:hypothetical protein